MKILRKITTRSFGATPSREVAVEFGRLGGQIFGVRRGTTAYPDGHVQSWTALVGRFLSSTPEGEILGYAPEAFVPGPYGEMLASDAASLAEGVSMEFAVDLRSVPSKSPIGYEWDVTPLFTRPPEDLQHLLAGVKTITAED